ncbi:hypothetical protein ACGFS9_15605 [Streptomyces sp. NPDC048566]|uniref:hypothetical protein n=1 Tax=Streptomyces sp. NPDC048566 TaxID=3365569 RepID=UPI00372482FB
MTVRQASGDQWDVLYDFNKVGSTTKQLNVIGGNTSRIDIGLEVTGPKYVDVPSFANRLQFMTGNKVWQQVATANVAKSVTLPACSTSHKPPTCFTTKLTDNSKFTQWSVSKPRRQAAAGSSPTTLTAAPAAARSVSHLGRRIRLSHAPGHRRPIRSYRVRSPLKAHRRTERRRCRPVR